MICESDWLGLCWQKAHDINQETIFDFKDFVAALALLIIIFTISDSRYRFRLSVSSVNIPIMIYIFGPAIGIFSLMVTLWFARSWLLPSFLNDRLWIETVLGVSFVILISTWVLNIYVFPSKINILNYRRFGKEIYRVLLRGSEEEIGIVSSEIERSAKNLITYASDRSNESENENNDGKEKYALEILYMLSNPRYSRALAKHAPATAIALFRETSYKKYSKDPISDLMRNVFVYSLREQDSLLYQELNRFGRDLIGLAKPLSKSLFSDFISD